LASVGIFVMMNELSQQMIRTVGSVFEMEQSDFKIEEFEKRLRIRIDELLQKDFARLINALYRLDVDEEKLKNQLNNQPATDAAELISKLIIERQLEKLQTRWQQGNRENISDEEKW
jgi:hypothetical protein